MSIEIIHDGSRLRAASHDEALNLLVPGHSELTSEEAERTRLAYALRVRRMVQSLLNAGEPFERCLDEERLILMENGDSPPLVTQWRSPVPLLLVASFYQPVGEIPQPRVDRPGQVWWIDPTTSRSLLETLHKIQWLELIVHGTTPSGSGGSDYENLGTNGSAGYQWRSLHHTTQ